MLHADSCDIEGQMLRCHPLIGLGQKIDLADFGTTISAQQNCDSLHVWDTAQDSGARLAGKAKHVESGLARRACRARRARRALGRLPGFLAS